MEDIPENYHDAEYPDRVYQRAALANFDLNLFLEDDEDSLEQLEEQIASLAEKLGHPDCLDINLREDEDKNLNHEMFKKVKNITIVKELMHVSKESENAKNRSIVAPKMFGLSSPDQDLQKLSEFEQLSTKQQAEEALKSQETLRGKFRCFIGYLALVSAHQQIQYKTNQQLLDTTFLKDQVPWFKTLVKQHSRIRDAKTNLAEEQDEEYETPLQRKKALAYLNPKFENENQSVTAESKHCILELQELARQLRSHLNGEADEIALSSGLPPSDELIYNSVIGAEKEEGKSHEDLFKISHLQIQVVASKISNLIDRIQSKAENSVGDGRGEPIAKYERVSDLVKLNLGLAGLTQDVNYMLKAIQELGQSLLRNLTDIKIEKNRNLFFNAQKLINLESLNLLQELSHLPEIFESSTTIQNEPVSSSQTLSLESAIDRGFDSYQLEGKYAWRGNDRQLAIFIQDSYNDTQMRIIKIQQDDDDGSGPNNRDWSGAVGVYGQFKLTDHFDIDGEEIILTKSGQTPSFNRIYRKLYDSEYGEEGSWYDWCSTEPIHSRHSDVEAKLVRFKYTHLYQLRKDSFKSHLCVVHDQESYGCQNEEARKSKRRARYYLLTINSDSETDKMNFIVKKVLFKYGAEIDSELTNEQLTYEICKETTLEVNQASQDFFELELSDFKVAEDEEGMKSSIRLMMKSKEQNEFACYEFCAQSGQLTSFFDYNTTVAKTDVEEEQRPISWAWLSGESELKVIDRRDNQEEYEQRFNTFKISQEEQEESRQQFFEKLECLDEYEFGSSERYEPYYEQKVRQAFHEPTDEQKKHQAKIESDQASSTPSVSNLDCMYLLSRKLYGFAQEFLSATVDVKGPSTQYLQSKLAVMQKSQTFVQVSKVLEVLLNVTNEINRISKEINDIESHVKAGVSSLSRTRVILDRYREVIGLLGYDVHFVLNCNIHALRRDGRITLPELLATGDDGDRKIAARLPLQLLELTFEYGKLIKEKRESFEVQGIDSDYCMQALMFSDDSLSSLLKFAQQKGQDQSNLVLTLMANRTDQSDSQSRPITQWARDTVKALLDLEEPTIPQRHFVQTYYANLILEQFASQNAVKACLEEEKEDQQIVNILTQKPSEVGQAKKPETSNGKAVESLSEALIAVVNCKKTNMVSSILEQLILAQFLRKDQDFTKTAIQLLMNSTELPTKVQHELFCLIGQDVMDQINPSQVQGTHDNTTASSLIMQSQLLSGGLQTHLYGYFPIDSLKTILKDCQRSKIADLEAHIEDAIKTLKEDKLDAKFNEDDLMHLQLIHSGRNNEIDSLISTLQVALKKKGGMVAAYCNQGQETGMILTRSAFAVMVKFSSLTSTIESLIEKLEEGKLTGDIPAEAGPEQDAASIKIFTAVQKGEEVLKCWANATQMRRWLTQKKQSLAQRAAAKGDDEWETTELKQICKKITRKAEFLVALQSPIGSFKSSQPDAFQRRIPSYVSRGKSVDEVQGQFKEWEESVQLWNNEIYHFGKLKSPHETAKEVKEAGTTSVLACLQSPIEVHSIISQVMTSSRNAILRLSAFNLISMLLDCDKDDTALAEIVAWFTSFQNSSQKLLHYTDGVKGCGVYLEEKLREIFFHILHKLASKLTSTNDPKTAKVLLQGFNCKFLGRDFGLLHDKVKIFSLLLRGGSGENNLIRACQTINVPSWHSIKASESSQELSKTLQKTFMDVYLAIIARISEPDALETIKIKQEGFTAIPEILKQKSLIQDNPYCELLVGQALDEIFRCFQRIVDDEKKKLKPESRGNSSIEREMREFDEADRIKNEYANGQDQLGYYFSMLYLLTNVAQVAPLPQKMLLQIATPYHIRLLFELLLVVAPKNKLKILKIIRSLLDNSLPSQLFTDALQKQLFEREQAEPMLFQGIQNCDPCASFFYKYALLIRSQQSGAYSHSKDLFAVSKQLLKQSLALIDNIALQDAFEIAIIKLEEASKAEQELLMTIVGASFDRICVDDEVRYTSRYFKTKTYEFSNSPMTVIKPANMVAGPNTHQVYSPSNQKFLEVEPGLFELLTVAESANRSIKVTKISIDRILQLITESTKISEALRTWLLKWLLMDVNCLEQLDKQAVQKFQDWLSSQTSSASQLLENCFNDGQLIEHEMISVMMPLLEEIISSIMVSQIEGDQRKFEVAEDARITTHEEDKKQDRPKEDNQAVEGETEPARQRMSGHGTKQVENRNEQVVWKTDKARELEEAKEKTTSTTLLTEEADPKAASTTPIESQKPGRPKRNSLKLNLFRTSRKTKLVQQVSKVEELLKLPEEALKRQEVLIRLIFNDWLTDSLVLKMKAGYAMQKDKGERDNYIARIMAEVDPIVTNHEITDRGSEKWEILDSKVRLIVENEIYLLDHAEVLASTHNRIRTFTDYEAVESVLSTLNGKTRIRYHLDGGIKRVGSHFQVISEAEWKRHKRIGSDKNSFSARASSKECPVRNTLLKRPDQGQSEMVNALKSLIIDRLYYQSYAVSQDATINRETLIKMISSYRIAKYTKKSNYHLTEWLRPEKNLEGNVITRAIDSLAEKSPKDADKVICEILDGITLDFNLREVQGSPSGEESLIRMSQMDVLRKIATYLVDTDRPIGKLTVKLIDAILISIQRMNGWFMGSKKPRLLVQIRKLLASLEEITQKIVKEPKSFEQGELQRILDLPSLADQNAMLPKTCKNIRSLFECLLLEVFRNLTTAANRAGLQSFALPYKLLTDYNDLQFNLGAQLTALEPLRPPSPPKNETKIVKIDSVDCIKKVNDWFMIDLNGAKTFTIQIQLEQDNTQESSTVQLPVGLATSSEPKENSTTKVHTVKGGQTLKLEKQSEGTLYIKYPFDVHSFLTLKTTQEASEFTAELKTYALNRPYDQILYVNDSEAQLLQQATSNLRRFNPTRSNDCEKLSIAQQQHQIKIPKGDKLKQLSSLSESYLLHQFVIQRTPNEYERYRGCNQNILTENGKLLNFSPFQGLTREWPKLHSEISDHIVHISTSSSAKNFYVIDDTGKLFIVYERNGKTWVISKMKTYLRDGSQLKKVHNVSQTVGTDDNERIDVIRATTTYDEEVVCSAYQSGENRLKSQIIGIGREFTSEMTIKEKKDEENKQQRLEDFHILSYEPSMTKFVKIEVGIKAVLGIDEDGEIWILAGQQNEYANLNLPFPKHGRASNSRRAIERPIKTDWMKKMKAKATGLVICTKYLLANIEHESTGSKSVVALDSFDRSSQGHFRSREFFTETVNSTFANYEKQFQIVQTYPRNAGDFLQNNSVFMIIKQKESTTKFAPISLELMPNLPVPSQTLEEEDIQITKELQDERDWKLMQVHHNINKQLSTKGKKALNFLNNNKEKPGFIAGFLNALLLKKPIVLKQDEIEDETKKSDTEGWKKEQVKKFIEQFISVFQSLYDLTPFFSYICEDPYLSRREVSQKLMSKYKSLCKLIRVELLQRIILSVTSQKTLQTGYGIGSITFNRISASSFKLLQRHERQGETKTLFSMLYEGIRRRGLTQLRMNNRRPFSVRLTGEGAQDCGGPMRDLISDVCIEVMSDALPLLIPTSNNVSKVEPNTDCYRLNPHMNEPYWLKKLIFLGYFLGWSLRSLGGLGIELAPAFWNRVCGGPTYVYSLEDLQSMDIFRHDTLQQLKSASEMFKDEAEFAAMYDGYNFEADFGDGETYVELCDGGSKKPVTIANTNDYIELYLKKFTEQESLQFQCIYQGIEDTCGKRMLLQMLPNLAAKRACASSKIKIKALKAVISLHNYGGGYGENEDEVNENDPKARFWRVMESFSHEDRQLFVKFATGRTRLAQGDSLRVEINRQDDHRLPDAGTCGNYVGFPAYSTDEIMSEKLLTAIRLCGEIDNDGGYGSEYGDENSNSEMDENEDARGEENRSEQATVNNTNWETRGDDEPLPSFDVDLSEDEGQGIDGLDANYQF